MNELPRVEHDPEDADVVYVAFADAAVARTAPLDDERVVDYGDDGSVVGIELLNANSGVDVVGLPHADIVERLLRDRGLPIADPVAAARSRAAAQTRDAFARAIAAAVRRYRTAHGLSLRAFARRAGMRAPDVARLERGEHAPSIALLERFVRELGMHFVIELGPPDADAAVLPPGLEVMTDAAAPAGSRLVVAAGASAR